MKIFNKGMLTRNADFRLFSTLPAPVPEPVCRPAPQPLPHRNGPPGPDPAFGPGSRPLLPHERRNLLYAEFEDEDWELLLKIFGDEDTAVAAMKIIRDAPPEMQILAAQIIDLIKEAE